MLAWILDVSPTGIRRKGRFSSRTGSPSAGEAGEQEGNGQSAKSLEMVLLGVFVPVSAFAILLGVFWFGDPVEKQRTGVSIATFHGPSIAVLPFEDLSMGAEDKGFFARGMHEDILIHLARVAGLKVISRTSVMPYANRRANVRVIGRELGVAHILEGSVRRTETQVRVTTQLIRVESDEHLWAQSFDADLENIFEVQTRIAIAIALESELIAAPVSSPSTAPRVVPAAYDAYLKARDLHRDLDAEDQTALAQARHLYELALQSDDSLAIAWVQLGILHTQAYRFGFDRSDQRPELARKALDRAEKLGSPADQLALAEGIYAYYVDRDFDRAQFRLSEAARLAPSNAEAHFYLAMVLRRIGQLDEAIAAQSMALGLDPLNDGYREEYALTLALADNLEEARQENLDLLRRDPTRPRARFQKWQLDLELDGRPDQLLDEILATPRDRWREQHYSMLEIVAVLAGRPESAVEILLARPAVNPDSGYRDYQIAVLEGFAGHPEERRARLEKADAKFQTFTKDWPDIMPVAGRGRIEALFAARAGDWQRALALQSKNVEAMPIDEDLIVGTPPLWLLLQFELEAGRTEAALATLERLHSKVTLGSVPYGGHYVLAHWPEFENARRDPRIREALDEIRPAYAEKWPERSHRLSSPIPNEP